jgi:hypothetical protein
MAELPDSSSRLSNDNSSFSDSSTVHDDVGKEGQDNVTPGEVVISAPSSPGQSTTLAEELKEIPLNGLLDDLRKGAESTIELIHLIQSTRDSLDEFRKLYSAESVLFSQDHDIALIHMAILVVGQSMQSKRKSVPRLMIT